MAVISGGELVGLSRPTAPLVDRIDLASPITFESAQVAYLELWRKQRAVRTTVSFLARNVAHLGLHSFSRNSDTDRQRLPADHPLAKLMDKPNPWTTHYRLMNATVHDLSIFDRGYWYGGEDWQQLVRLPPTMVKPVGDSWLTPEAFELKGSKGKRVIPADQVVYFRGYAGDTDYGTSPLESLRQVLAEEFAASKARSEILRNGARVSGYLERPSAAPPWSTEAADRFKRDWQSQYSGGGPQAGGTPILEDGMTFKDATQSSKDLQYIEARKLTREEVAAVYHVPPPMVGIMDSATFSNITQQHKMLYQDTLGPTLRMISEEIALQLIPRIAADEDVYVEFNLREKLSGSFEERADQIQKSVGAPWLTINEARALDNRQPVDGGDDLVRPLNTTQNGDQNPIPAEPGGGAA